MDLLGNSDFEHDLQQLNHVCDIDSALSDPKNQINSDKIIVFALSSILSDLGIGIFFILASRYNSR